MRRSLWLSIYIPADDQRAKEAVNAALQSLQYRLGDRFDYDDWDDVDDESTLCPWCGADECMSLKPEDCAVRMEDEADRQGAEGS